MLSCYRAIVLSLVLIFPVTASAINEWRSISDGFQYKKVVIERKSDRERPPVSGLVHIFKVDLSKFGIGVATAKQFGMPSASAETFAEKTGAVIAINGGFFTPEYAPLGLIVNHGKMENPLKWVSWWHIFQVVKGNARIVTKPEFALTADVETAIESGPRLIINGEIPATLKPSSAERSALGITSDGMVVLAATEAAPLGTQEFARLLKNAGCTDAINLDGGSSTQLYAKNRGLEVHRPGFGPVANAVVVIKR